LLERGLASPHFALVPGALQFIRGLVRTGAIPMGTRLTPFTPPSIGTGWGWRGVNHCCIAPTRFVIEGCADERVDGRVQIDVWLVMEYALIIGSQALAIVAGRGWVLLRCVVLAPRGCCILNKPRWQLASTGFDADKIALQEPADEIPVRNRMLI